MDFNEQLTINNIVILKKHTGKCAAVLILLISFFIELNVFAGEPKLYIATDKENYAPEATVQFQVFLLNPSSNTSRTVFVELLDCYGNKLAKKMLPVNFNISSGNIDIPKKVTAEFYLLYCYILNKDSIELDCIKKIFISGKNKQSGSVGENKVFISCFIEGATFVAKALTSILIRSTDETGSPLMVSGELIDDENNTVSIFETDEEGYAKINFYPEEMSRYFVVAETKKGLKITRNLPPVSASGVAMNVAVSDSSITYRVYSNTKDTSMLDYNVEIISNNELLYKSSITFQLNLSLILEELRAKDFPEGFLVFRLIDKYGKLYSQRIIYNNPIIRQNNLIRIIDTVNNKFVVTSIPGYVNGYGYVNIVVKDKDDDTGLKNDKNLRLFAEQAVLLDNSRNKITYNDVLIATEKTVFDHTAKNENVNQFLTLSGTVYYSDNRLVKNKKLNLVFLHKNLKKDFLVVKKECFGIFEINNLVFYDTVSVYHQLADKSDEKNDLSIELTVDPSVALNGNNKTMINFICATPSSSGFDSSNINIDSASFRPDAKTLKEVTVTGQKGKTNSEKFIEKNVSGQYSSSNFLNNEFDFIKNPQAIDNRLLFDFLKGRVPLKIITKSNGTTYIANHFGAAVGIYFNDMELDQESMDLISFLEIKDVALVRYYTMSRKARTVQKKIYNPLIKDQESDGGDLMIYTKKDFTPSDPKVKGLPKTQVVGYNIENPVRALHLTSDPSQSLYWRSNWSPQKEETFYIELPAGYKEKNIQLLIEGFNNLMAPYSFTKNLIFN